MKLNPDCIRDILFAIEDRTTMSKVFYLDKDICSDIFPQYDLDVIMYHLRQCNLYGYLYNASFSMTKSCTVVDLTPKAHEFINNIRENNNWHKTKEIASKVGSFSLEALTNIASGIISSLIQSHLGLT